jgi:hypothetical protein
MDDPPGEGKSGSGWKENRELMAASVAITPETMRRWQELLMRKENGDGICYPQ